jgi:peptidoglycan/xylan/chitin deacetylase (PgdA/CDA1 family)
LSDISGAGAVNADPIAIFVGMGLQKIKSALLAPIGTIVRSIGVSDAVALTFDDGPDPEITPAVLDVLARHRARATFFLLADHALARRELVQRILDEGHEIGLHFDRHDRITALPPLTALGRMIEARRSLIRLAGPVRLFRPPYGSQNLLTYFFARLLGFTVIGWNRSADDWLEQSAEDSARRAYEHLQGGDIVLLHDGLELSPGEVRPTLDRPRVVDILLEKATSRGLVSVTVGTLLRRGSPGRTRWFR